MISFNLRKVRQYFPPTVWSWSCMISCNVLRQYFPPPVWSIWYAFVVGCLGRVSVSLVRLDWIGGTWIITVVLTVYFIIIISFRTNPRLFCKFIIISFCRNSRLFCKFIQEYWSIPSYSKSHLYLSFRFVNLISNISYSDLIYSNANRQICSIQMQIVIGWKSLMVEGRCQDSNPSKPFHRRRKEDHRFGSVLFE